MPGVKRAQKNGKSKSRRGSKADSAETFMVPVPDSRDVGDVDEVVDLGNGIYWVGVDIGSPFRCNPYLIVDDDEAVLIDPGGLQTAKAVAERVASIIDLRAIRYIIAHHQDPDVCSAVNYFTQFVPKSCQLVTHSRLGVLIDHFGSGMPFYEVDNRDLKLTFGARRRLTFGHTPYLHSPGAIVTYDAESGTVFTSDIFGGVTERWELNASEENFKGIEAFHVGYMPTPDILRHGLDVIEELGPINRIAPQHGSVVEGALIGKFFDQLRSLEVGTYADSVFQERRETLAMAQSKSQILDRISTPVLQLDTDLTVKYINTAGAEIAGVSVGEAIGRKCYDLMGSAHCKTGNCAGTKTLETGQSHSAETTANPPQGSVKNLNIRYFHSPVKDEQGEVLGTIEYITDISAEKEVQAKVRAAAESSKTVAMEVSSLASELGERSKSLNEQTSVVVASTEEVTQTMESVTDGAEQSREAVSSVAAATEEMTSTVSEIAERAERARSVADVAVRSVEAASNRVEELGRAAKLISQVTETIVEIADQTKLLALNATIEAARAGEAGKGFAVVASEVKELAKQTNGATADIREKIEAIQTSTESTVAEIGSIQEVIGEVNEFVSSIASATEEQTVATKEIAESVTYASAGLGEMTSQLNQAALTLTDVTGNVSGTAVEVARNDETADSLTVSAEKLTSALGDLENSVRAFDS